MSVQFINASGNPGLLKTQTQLVILVDSNGNSIDTLGTSNGVSSINTFTGAVSVSAGSGITIGNAGNTITVNANAQAGGVTSVNTATGALNIASPVGGLITITTNVGTGTITVSGSQYGFASASNSGILSSGDWTTFNNKQNQLGYTPLNSVLSGNIQASQSGVYGLGTSNFPFSGIYSNSIYEGTRTVITSYNASILDTNIFTNQSSSIVVGLPAFGPGKHYRIISIVASVTNTVTLSGIGCNIDGAATKTINSAALGGASNIISDGANLWTMASLF